MQVCALPGLGIGDLDPQTAALNASTLERLFDWLAIPSTTDAMSLSWTEGTWISTKAVIQKKESMTLKMPIQRRSSASATARPGYVVSLLVIF